MKTVTVTFEYLAGLAGFSAGPDGKLNLPATQETADKLAFVANTIGGEWKPGDEPFEVVATGAGPVWGWLAIAHGFHGRCVRMRYVAPNTPNGIVIWSHGV